MPRMTLLDDSLWLGLSAPRGPSGAGKPDAGYPPYNVELLPEEPEALRITLAVAGFGANQLEVTTENGELSIRGKQSEEQPREFLHRGSNSSEAFAWQAGLRSARRSFKTAFSSSSSRARAKRNG